MRDIFIQYLSLILIVLGLVMLANKLRLAYPIVLVLGGLALSFFDGFSEIVINPELVFLIFLPPLLYEAAWQVSWKESWKWRGLIIAFAFPVVILTSCAVALVSSALIPDFNLALGFLLGGIVSPPDAVSATTIMRQVRVPKSLVSDTLAILVKNVEVNLHHHAVQLVVSLDESFHAILDRQEFESIRGFLIDSDISHACQATNATV